VPSGGNCSSVTHSATSTSNRTGAIPTAELEAAAADAVAPEQQEQQQQPQQQQRPRSSGDAADAEDFTLSSSSAPSDGEPVDEAEAQREAETEVETAEGIHAVGAEAATATVTGTSAAGTALLQPSAGAASAVPTAADVSPLGELGAWSATPDIAGAAPGVVLGPRPGVSVAVPFAATGRNAAAEAEQMIQMLPQIFGQVAAGALGAVTSGMQQQQQQGPVVGMPAEVANLWQRMMQPQAEASPAGSTIPIPTACNTTAASAAVASSAPSPAPPDVLQQQWRTAFVRAAGGAGGASGSSDGGSGNVGDTGAGPAAATMPGLPDHLSQGYAAALARELGRHHAARASAVLGTAATTGSGAVQGSPHGHPHLAQLATHFGNQGDGSSSWEQQSG